SSPGDILYTGLAAAVLAMLILLARPRRRRPRDGPRRLAAALLQIEVAGLAHAAAVAGLVALIGRMAANSDLDLGDFSLLPPDGARLAVVLGIALLAAAPVIAASGLVRRGTRGLGAALTASAART